MMFMQEARKQYENYSKEIEQKLNKLASEEQEVSFKILPVDMQTIKIDFWVENSNEKYDDYQIEIHLKIIEADYWFNQSKYIKMFEMIIQESNEQLAAEDQGILEDLKEKYLYYSVTAE